MTGGGQERIGGDHVADPKAMGHQCEWPHDEPTPATHALPVLRRIKGGKSGATVDTGTRVHCCDDHLKIAEDSNPIRPSIKR